MTTQSVTAGAPPAAPLSAPRRRAILAIIMVSYFMILLDNSVIFTGIPSIRADLDLGPAALSWVQDAYTLVFGGLLLLAARAGDLVGRRRLFIGGLLVFGVASLLVGSAQSGGFLIGARALQGVGAAIVAPTSLSLITATFTGRDRARAIAWYAATAGIGASLGMLVGGAAAQFLSWRAGFVINVPIAAVMAALALRVLPDNAPAKGRFDVVGAICATLGVGSLVYGVVESASAGWFAPSTLTAIGIGVALLAALAVNEGHAEHPIMPLRLFRSRERSGAYAVRMLYLGAMMGFFYYTTQYLQGSLGFTPLQAGTAFLPMTVVNFAVALAVPRFAPRLGTGTALGAGISLTLAGTAWLSRAGLGDDYWAAVALPMVLIGIGQGLAFAPMTAAGVAGVDPSDSGAASGLVNTAHQLGSSLGLGVLVAVSTRLTGGGDGAAAVAERAGTALLGSTTFLALALVITLACIAGRPASHGEGTLLPVPDQQVYRPRD